MAALSPPRERGGWWHAYVCPAHGTELLHDELLDGVFPDGGALCPYGCRIDTPEVRGAWTVLAHQACAARLRTLAAAPDPAERAEAADGLARYAALYAELTDSGEHAGAQPWMLRGRMFHQALTEAVWAVQLGHAVRSLTERGAGDGQYRPPAAVRAMLDALAAAADTARAALVARGEERSNYTAWLTASALVCGGGTDPDLRGHPLLATHADGWEWEGSTYYHVFVLRAYLLSLRGTDPAALPPPVAERLAAMVSVLAGIATPGGELPELHDGPYRRPGALAELHEVSLLTHQLFRGEPLARVGEWAARRAGPPPADLPGWFAGEPLPSPPAPPRRVFPDAGFAVLRTPGIHAVLDAGPHGGSHGHRDKLSLYLYGADGTAWQPDRGQVPYGHGHFRAHYAATAAHPAFAVDGGEQRPVDARLRAAEGRASGICADAYPGVTATREIAPGPAGTLIDVLTVVAEEERRLTAQLRPAVAFTVRCLPGGQVVTAWGGPADAPLAGHHVASAASEFAVVPVAGPAADPMIAGHGADWSVRGERAVFASVYRAGTSPVRALRLTGRELIIELTDDTVHHHGLTAAPEGE